MPDPTHHNHAVIAEFRANGGKVEGRPLLVLLTTKGEKTGNSHTTPLAGLEEGDRLFVFASKKGAPVNPQWYRNLVANPEVTVEVGSERFEATASSLPEPERTEVFAEMASSNANFIEYQSMTTRVIPVVELVRNSS